MVHWLRSPIFPCLFGWLVVPPWWHPQFYMPQTPKPIHFLKAYDNSYSKMNREHKYKDKDEYKDKDKDKDAEKITESLTVCYIFGILMTQAFQEWWWIPPPGQPPQCPRPPWPPQPPKKILWERSEMARNWSDHFSHTMTSPLPREGGESG